MACHSLNRYRGFKLSLAPRPVVSLHSAGFFISSKLTSGLTFFNIYKLLF